MKKTIILIAVIIIAVFFSSCAATTNVETPALISDDPSESTAIADNSQPLPSDTTDYFDKNIQENLEPVVLEYPSVLSSSGFDNMFVRSDGSLFACGDDIGKRDTWDDYNGNILVYSRADNIISASCSRWSFVYIDSAGVLWGNGTDLWNAEQFPNIEIPDHIRIMDNAVMAHCGFSFCLVLKDDGTVWAWDSRFSNNKSVLDREVTCVQDIPVKIADNVRYIDITGGQYVIQEDGSLWRLKLPIAIDKAETNMEEYFEFVMENIKQVSSGDQTFAVDEDGALWIWGDREHMGIEGNPYPYLETGEPYKLMDDVKYAHTDFSQFAVIKNDGSLWVWGNNWNGALANDSLDYTTAPHNILDNIVDVMCGDGNIYAIDANGVIWESGVNINLKMELGHIYEENDYTELIKKASAPHRFVDGSFLPLQQN